MQYLGGKFKAGRVYAEMIAPQGPWWEPFCGGLNVSQHLANFKFPGVISDINSDLIELYRAVRSGWVPPTNVTKEEWDQAKRAPASPLKTFIGFGCSFSGMWFSSYAKPGTFTYKSGQTQNRNYAQQFAKALLTQVEATKHLTLKNLDFLTVAPFKGIDTLYCDPPYQGTQGYGNSFDHAAFWRVCGEWAMLGTKVIVSEYACPVPAQVLWQKQRKSQLGKTQRTEKLFRVLPP